MRCSPVEGVTRASKERERVREEREREGGLTNVFSRERGREEEREMKRERAMGN
jgi:hypothetical protein